MKELFDNYDTAGPVDEEKPTFSDLGWSFILTTGISYKVIYHFFNTF